MGAYDDPYSNFGRLSTEMWLALRLVVDTGLHSKGWSMQEVVDFMSRKSAEPLASVESEVKRYLVLPGQATSYKVGMIKIRQLRARFMRTRTGTVGTVQQNALAIWTHVVRPEGVRIDLREIRVNPTPATKMNKRPLYGPFFI
jgi:hypothetical protein